MLNMNRSYNRPIVAPIVPPIVDQTCTLLYIIPMGDLSKYDRRGHSSPSGYGALHDNFSQHKGTGQNSLAVGPIFNSQLQPHLIGKAIHSCLMLHQFGWSQWL